MTQPVTRRRRSREDLAAELAGLADLSLEDLKRRWTELYGSPPPARLGRRLMTRAVAYRLQEQVLGGLGVATLRRLARAAEDIAAGRALSRPRIKPGTRLLRTWQGVTHEVIVLDSGVRYGGRDWRSLSAVAREITGARWSGPRFFGLDRHGTA